MDVAPAYAPSAKLAGTSASFLADKSRAIRVLMVCEGNVRRSPIAAVLWRERFRHQPVLVQSAGLHALSGVGIDPGAETVLVDHGLTGKPHIARQLTTGLVDAADLVLVMDCAQAVAVQALSRYGIGHTFMLGKWSGGVEIPDPSQRTRAAFASVYQLIRQAVDDWHWRLNGHAGAAMNSHELIPHGSRAPHSNSFG